MVVTLSTLGIYPNISTTNTTVSNSTFHSGHFIPVLLKPGVFFHGFFKLKFEKIPFFKSHGWI